jgi:putative tryptophan/tyrosine transport system substrate-binding protein
MASHIERRKFLATLGSAVAALPLAARAQQPGMPVVGFLHSASAGSFTNLVVAFRQGLSETGYIEGQNVIIDLRWAEGQNDRLPELAADLVRRQVIVIAAAGGISARAAKTATTTIPVVFWIEGDPVEVGLVASLNRPGGNLTGVTTLGAELTTKRLELLRELVPTADTIAVLIDPTTLTAETLSRDLQAAARALGLQVHILHASAEREFDSAFATLAKLRAGGVVIGPGPFFSTRSKLLAALAIRHGIPAIFQFREFVAAGGLMSYGGSVTDLYRLAGVYTGRILNGEKPRDLPVQQSTKVELFLNLKTAQALGIDVPPMLLARADEVIE